MRSDEVRFCEVQQLRQTWVILLAVLAGALAWVPLVVVLAGDGRHEDPMWLLVVVAVAFGIGLPLLVWFLRLTVEVRDDRVEVHYRPFTRRTIALADVVSVAAVTYRPVREYGGWGVKGWSRRKLAYNVSGNRGVLLTLVDGRTVLLGSRRPDELAAALETARSTT